MLEHGGNLDDAVARFAFPRDAWLDLSTGVNPQSYPAPLLAPEVWHRLPESSAALLEAARSYYRASDLLAVAGSQAVIQALPRLRPHSRVVVAAPAYAEHAYRWRQGGHSVSEIAYADLDAAVDDCDVMVVCNPNNPTGARVAPDQLLSWAARLAVRQGWLVVDEAFIDVTPKDSVMSEIGQPGLIVLRSIGKFFGLAGLRLGFAGADAALLVQLAELIGPWAVSTAAQIIGAAALSDFDWQTAMRANLRVQGDRLHTLLASCGIQASGSALYQWWPEPQAAVFHQHMARHAIWVRLFSQDALGIRLGLPHHESDWQRLQAALQSWVEVAANGMIE